MDEVNPTQKRRKGQNLKSVIGLRLKPEEKQFIFEMARKEGLTASQYCRMVIFEGIYANKLKMEMENLRNTVNALTQLTNQLNEENRQLKELLKTMEQTIKELQENTRIDLKKLLAYLDEILNNPDEHEGELLELDKWLTDRNLRLETVKVWVNIGNKKLQIVNKKPGLYV